MRTILRFTGLSVMALALAGCATVPRSPPPEIGAPWFYDKYVSARGIPILSSARATGGQYMADGAEDVLGLPSSRYYGETIFVHEFAHQLLFAVQAVDPALYARVEAAYAAALAEGLWKDEYGSTTVQEYWAEGTQFWFESNRLQVFDGRRILNREDLAAYDPRLHSLLGQVYGDTRRLASDPFHRSPARVPPGPVPTNTAEVC